MKELPWGLGVTAIIAMKAMALRAGITAGQNLTARKSNRDDDIPA